MPIPADNDKVQIWSQMSHQADGFLKGHDSKISGNGKLNENKATFIWLHANPQNKSSTVLSGSEMASIPTSETWDQILRDLNKTPQEKFNVIADRMIVAEVASGSSAEGHEDIQLKLHGSSKYITANTKNKKVELKSATSDSHLVQMFTMELWPQINSNKEVTDAGLHHRFKVQGTEYYLGCNGAGTATLMEQKGRSGASYGNFFPNPGTLFYIYDLSD